MLRKYLLSLAVSATSIASGCASAGTDPNTGPAQAPAEAPSAESEVSDEEAEALAAIAAEEEAMTDAPMTGDASPGEADPARNITYRVSQEGLRVEVEGAEFVPTAKPVRISGGWGVELSVDAPAPESKVLFSPESGPLAFGGRVIPASGQVDSFGDQRVGGSDVSFGAGAPHKFSRTWPSDGAQALKKGDKLELQVGLWGFGGNETSRRPVRKFIVVNMTAVGTSPLPLIEPPPQ